MTHDQLIDMFRGRKVYVAGRSGEIQSRLIILGWKWSDGTRAVRNEEDPFLYVGEDMVLSSGHDMHRFRLSALKEMTADEILLARAEPPSLGEFLRYLSAVDIPALLREMEGGK